MDKETYILVNEKKGLLNLNELDNLKLNIGCGDVIYSDCINIDKAKLNGVDFVWDLEKVPFPFKSNSIAEIKCEHILEHIQNFIPLMEELWRICKPRSIIHILAPYYKYEAAYRDPTHVRFFTEHSFDYFQEGVKFNHYSKARFRVIDIKLRNRFISNVKNFHKKIIGYVPFKKFLNMFCWNMFSEICYELEVVK